MEDKDLQRFISRIIDQAINTAIWSIMRRLPLVVVIVVLGLLIGAAVYWKLY